MLTYSIKYSFIQNPHARKIFNCYDFHVSKNNNAESVRNCVEKAQIGIVRESSILEGVPVPQKMAAPTKIESTFIIYNYVEKNSV